MAAATGCGGSPEKEDELRSALDQRLDSFESSIRQLEKGSQQEQDNLDQIAKLRYDVDRAKARLAEFKGVSDLLKIVSHKGNDLVVRGIIVEDGTSNSVALYAGEDRAAIGAYGTNGDGHVGWAATVTPEGQVMAGKAER
jgi:hypothetical protein